ncbi:AgmX/PglI C-terminal domain-containing protein [Simiduia agarivorans]|uniref:TonB family C-terminal domain-containing protein n=1 Tax=Simiduia agarivorans (strain DSM 21679 / JCM 13881 / BCRC 17597 / SA1) TaxID=1117647 RepID=K4L080_SIMAS|nr:AgmX/PglI C-terminal domain-containing protein [Simiduia agarivorans]AFU99577.1 TonB family C-terminal domain-containing protein [Simiduia agarivorans SA1 = DSM 21679]
MSIRQVIIPPALLLPWTSLEQDNERYKKILLVLLALFLVLGILVPLIDVPEIEREKAEALPPQLAKIILEKKELPPPPPPKPKEPEKPKEEKPKEKPKEPEKPKEKPKEEPKPQDVAKAREKAATSGLLQFQDDLMDMREALDASDIASANITRGAAEAEQMDRSMITSGAKATSGGISSAAVSRDTGGVAMAGRETTKVDSKLAAGGTAVKAEKNNREVSGRSEEEIRRVMDKNKAAIFAIYNRALRKNPTLQGKVVVKMIIEPNGSVSAASLVSSDLNDPDLESKILSRLKLIRFASENVLQTPLTYSFDFLPY